MDKVQIIGSLHGQRGRHFLAISRADQYGLLYTYVVMSMSHHLAEEACLRQLDVGEGRVPEKMGRRCKELLSSLSVGKQGKYSPVLSLFSSHKIPERSLIALSKAVP